MATKIQFTDARYQEMQQKLRELEITEGEVLERLTTARDMGDLSENGAYKYAKFELGNVRRQMRELRHLLETGEPMQPYVATGTVAQGSTVILETKGKSRTFLVVNEYEADLTQNRISYKSPIGSAIMGKKVGEVVTVLLPQGEVVYTILAVT